MKIIGIGGTNGAGKDTIAAMLVERHNYLFVSATDIFVKELNKRGWPIDRTHKSRLSAEWRREYGMAVVVDKAIEFAQAHIGSRSGVVIASLRHPSEADHVHAFKGVVVWADANPKVRYDRIQRSLHERVNTHAEQGKTFEEFLADEEREMHPEGDAATLNMAGVKEKADIMLLNNDDDIPAFKNKAEVALTGYINS